MLISDDEAVALAIAAGSFWPSPLPTVDIEDDAELHRAAMRGRRSLMLRGLLTADGDSSVISPEVLALSAPVAGAQKTVCLFLGDESLNSVGFDLYAFLYPATADDAWRMESVGDGGIRSVEQVSASHARDLVTEAVGAALRATEGTADPSVRLVCAAANSGDVLAFRMGPEGYSTFANGAGDGAVRPVEGDSESAVSTRLWAHVGVLGGS